jgi:curli biogenesis system outer membrane secretion channel CsgG
MKAPFAFACVALALATAPALADQNGGLRYSIVVSKFENRTGTAEGQALGATFGTVLTDSLQKTGRFIVLGEKDMRIEAIGEQDFGASGRVAGGNKKPAMGQMTPAQLLVKGEITHFQQSTSGGKQGIVVKGFKIGTESDTAQINAVIYVVDSTTGQVAASRKVKGEASKFGVDMGMTTSQGSMDLGRYNNTNVGTAIEKAIDEAVDFIVHQLEKIPWEGTVIMVKDNKVYFNRGSREGVSQGQNFVVGKSEVLRDPNTGEVLDVSMEKAGKLVVEQVREKLSIARIVEGSGIEKGMTVSAPGND